MYVCNVCMYVCMHACMYVCIYMCQSRIDRAVAIFLHLALVGNWMSWGCLWAAHERTMQLLMHHWSSILMCRKVVVRALFSWFAVGLSTPKLQEMRMFWPGWFSMFEVAWSSKTMVSAWFPVGCFPAKQNEPYILENAAHHRWFNGFDSQRALFKTMLAHAGRTSWRVDVRCRWSLQARTDNLPLKERWSWRTWTCTRACPNIYIYIWIYKHDSNLQSVPICCCLFYIIICDACQMYL